MFDQDSNQTSGTSLPSKKDSSARLQIPTKNGKKNNGQAAKESLAGGAIMAAVTKRSNNKSSSLSPQVPLPEMKPNGNGNGNSSSPLLNSLSSAALVPPTSHNTNEWIKNVPPYSTSPGNLINLSESPPTVPSSYEDKPPGFGWQREQRGSPIPSASPPTGRRRPLSYQMDGNFQYPEDYHPQKSSYAARRSSMYSTQSQNARFGPYPPLPHQPQAHFYGVPDANLSLSPTAAGLTPGDRGLYCGFDSLSFAQGSSKQAENVIVAGYEGGINIHSITRRGLNKILTLDGLRGGVYHAKILPWTSQQAKSDHFPLIAMVVHGPFWSSSDASSESDEYTVPPSETQIPQSESVRGSPRSTGQPYHGDDSNPIEYYQTTVEVYSLVTKHRVATLLSVPKSLLAIPTTSPLFTASPPAGSLAIHADRGNIAVASGTTGEVWLFRQFSSDQSFQTKFKCIGKVWTTIQSGLSVEPPDLNSLIDSGPANISKRPQYKSAIFTLSGRWLAYCPSTPSSQISLRATVLENVSTTRVPGLNAYAPPQLPTTNCMVDTPDKGSVIQKVAQVATQNFISGVEYSLKQGGKYWNTYWNKSPPSQQANVAGIYQTQTNSSNQFPPTHGNNSQSTQATKDPGLISILDLDTLAQQTSGSSPHPLATFLVPQGSGCSFLSLSPSGLVLFTASSKGDVQFVWDLMRIQYSRSSLLKGNLPTGRVQSPCVREIAHFSRMTVARIVDVEWAIYGERFSFVTEPGTVHVLDLPASAFAWPPRRRGISMSIEASASDPSSTALSAVNVASSAVSSLWTAARPLVASRRRRSSTGLSSITAASVTSQAGQSLGAVSRSVGAATGKMNEMRKSTGTKLHLPKVSALPGLNCVRLFNGKSSDSIYVVGGGVIRIYTVKSRRADRTADRQKASRGAKHVEYTLPPLPNFKIAPGGMRDFTQDDMLDISERDHGDRHWKPKPQIFRSPGAETSIPQAEIESNAPYQPFHTDRRVGLYIYSYEKSPLPTPSVSALLSPHILRDERPTTPLAKSKSSWVFGGLIKTVKLDVGPPHTSDDDFEAPIDHRALPSSAIERVMRIAENDQDQIVVTTRRRKGAVRAGIDDATDADEEAWFEDDCEVLDFADQRV